MRAPLVCLPGVLAVALCAPGARADDAASVIVVLGAAGTPAHGARFEEAAAGWKRAAAHAGARHAEIGRDPSGGPSDHQRLRDVLGREGAAKGPLWLVLLGHGTFDGRTARFNLRGPDLTATELAAWLGPLRRPLVILNTAPASAPFLKALSGPDRIVVTATRTGWEQNATRLGPALAQAIADPEADLDRDGRTSLFEAFLTAARRVEAAYEQDGLLAAEHPLLDDNGDGLGTPADFFQGLRPAKQATEGKAPDGQRARELHLVAGAPEHDWPPDLLARRDELELAIAQLRKARPQLAEATYYARLERLVTELARLFARVEGRAAARPR